MNVETRGIPVLILTAEEGSESESAGLDSGADDYVSKSVAPDALVSRVRALLRNSVGASARLMFIGREFWRSTIALPISKASSTR